MLQHISFLGTSAGSPSKYRNVTSHALTFENGRVWLLDCGEGTQHRIMTCPSVKSSRIDVILITHLHGDHCFGLPGLLATMSLHMTGRSDSPVTIVGPMGIKNMTEVNLQHSATVLNFDLQFVELEEFGKEHKGTKCRQVGSFDGISVAAYTLEHRVPCWGYILQEPEKRGKINMKKAKEYGLKGKMIGDIVKEGELSIEGKTIKLEDVSDEARPGKKIILLGDTSNSNEMLEDGRGCDILVHEATFDKNIREKALETGHSTSEMAGEFAKALGAHYLILTHFSSRYCHRCPGKPFDYFFASKEEGSGRGEEAVEGEITVEQLQKEAKEAAGSGVTVYAANDYDCFEYAHEKLKLKPEL
eukprot:Nk52_evm56s554 gene=Nk52_evmTU56s554